MKSLSDYIKESNITNDERMYRNFMDAIGAKVNNVAKENIKVERSSKGNWQIFDGEKKLFIVSAAMLSDEVAAKYDLLKK